MIPNDKRYARVLPSTPPCVFFIGGACHHILHTLRSGPDPLRFRLWRQDSAETHFQPSRCDPQTLIFHVFAIPCRNCHGKQVGLKLDSILGLRLAARRESSGVGCEHLCPRAEGGRGPKVATQMVRRTTPDFSIFAFVETKAARCRNWPFSQMIPNCWQVTVGPHFAQPVRQHGAMLVQQSGAKFFPMDFGVPRPFEESQRLQWSSQNNLESAQPDLARKLRGRNRGYNLHDCICRAYVLIPNPSLSTLERSLWWISWPCSTIKKAVLDAEVVLVGGSPAEIQILGWPCGS